VWVRQIVSDRVPPAKRLASATTFASTAFEIAAGDDLEVLDARRAASCRSLGSVIDAEPPVRGA
jgi:hypothetical protein